MATPRPTRYLVKAFARYSTIDGVYCGVDIIVNGSEQKRVLNAPKTVGINLADWCDSHAAAIFFALSVLHPEAEVAIDYCARTMSTKSGRFADLEPEDVCDPLAGHPFP